MIKRKGHDSILGYLIKLQCVQSNSISCPSSILCLANRLDDMTTMSPPPISAMHATSSGGLFCHCQLDCSVLGENSSWQGASYLLAWPAGEGALELEQGAADLVADGGSALLVVDDWYCGHGGTMAATAEEATVPARGGGYHGCAVTAAGEETAAARGGGCYWSMVAVTGEEAAAARRGGGGGDVCTVRHFGFLFLLLCKLKCV